MHVLVVEDDHTVAEVVLRYLQHAGFGTAHAADGPSALALAAAVRPSLVVLDLMLPGIDGLEVCRRLRERYTDLPVIMLTARGEESDRVLGLEVGADDYLTKPFSPRELVLRIQSVLRRAAAGPTLAPRPGGGEPEVLVDGELEVDVTGHRAQLRGQPLPLTAREFDLLTFLLRHPGQAFTRDQLMNQVWGWEFGDQSTVTVHVRRVREKVELDPANPVRLSTVWGVGYRWDPA